MFLVREFNVSLFRLCTIVALALAGMAGSSSAHELKVFASRQLIPESGGKSTIYLGWGHRVPVDELLEEESIDRYDLITPVGSTTPMKKSGVSIQANVVDFKDAGVHTVVATRKPSTWTYVIENNGNRRLKPGSKIDHAGAEIESGTHYAEFAKTLILVGKPSDDAPKAAGLPVEIIPLDGPAKWTANKDIRFQILQNGKPVPTVDIVARNVGFKPDIAWNYATESNRNGEFTIRPARPGTWIVGVEFRKLTKGCDARAIRLRVVRDHAHLRSWAVTHESGGECRRLTTHFGLPAPRF